MKKGQIGNVTYASVRVAYLSVELKSLVYHNDILQISVQVYV